MQCSIRTANRVLDARDSSVGVDGGTILVQLPQAHDAVAEQRNVVDTH